MFALCWLRSNRIIPAYLDVDFTRFTPTDAIPVSETKLLIRIDTKGISKAQFAELIAFCSICHTYMTRRSAAFHRGGCHPSHGGFNHPHGSNSTESATKTLLRLLTCGNPAGGVSETRFCSLFSMCPRCLIFMTWDAARFHECFEGEENLEASASDHDEES